MTKNYNFSIRGASNIKTIENFVNSLNNCEFCNKGEIIFSLKSYEYNEKREIHTLYIEINYYGVQDLNEKLVEVVNCECCHNNISILTITPVFKSN